MRRYPLAIAVLAASVVIFVAVELITPKPVDWSMSFSRSDKIPYGAHILHALLPDLFPGARVSASDESIYDTLKKRNLRGANYIIIDNTISFDKQDTDELMRFVKDGNAVFIAAGYYLGEFASRLSLATAPEDAVADAMGVNLANRTLRARHSYVCRRGTANIRFTGFQKGGAAVLGVNDRRGANFIRIRYGRGVFYLSSIPFAYTNFNMLEKNNAEYVFRSLSYLPVRDTVWDEYYKAGRPRPSTPLRFVLSREPLAWAYYTGMACLLLVVAFGARRRQRAIPVVHPPENATLEFVRTVGRLYFHEGNNKNIAEKMICYFYERLGSRVKFDALHRGEGFVETVAEATGMPRGRVSDIVRMTDRVRESPRVSDEELATLRGLIEECNRALKGKTT